VVIIDSPPELTQWEIVRTRSVVRAESLCSERQKKTLELYTIFNSRLPSQTNPRPTHGNPKDLAFRQVHPSNESCRHKNRPRRTSSKYWHPLCLQHIIIYMHLRRSNVTLQMNYCWTQAAHFHFVQISHAIFWSWMEQENSFTTSLNILWSFIHKRKMVRYQRVL